MKEIEYKWRLSPQEFVQGTIWQPFGLSVLIQICLTSVDVDSPLP